MQHMTCTCTCACACASAWCVHGVHVRRAWGARPSQPVPRGALLGPHHAPVGNAPRHHRHRPEARVARVSRGSSHGWAGCHLPSQGSRPEGSRAARPWSGPAAPPG
eukprot:scaffold47171_cov30-Phaeocystis_antarctica.AAC.3